MFSSEQPSLIVPELSVTITTSILLDSDADKGKPDISTIAFKIKRPVGTSTLTERSSPGDLNTASLNDEPFLKVLTNVNGMQAEGSHIGSSLSVNPLQLLSN